MPGFGRLSGEVTLDAKGVATGVAQVKQQIAGLASSMSGGLGGVGGVGNMLGGFSQSALGAIFSPLTGMLSGAAIGGGILAYMKSIIAESADIVKAGRRTGLGTGEYERLERMGVSSGVSGETMGLAAQRLKRSIGAAQITGAGRNIFQQLGLDPAAMSQMSPSKSLEAAATAISAIGDASRRAYFEVALFGRAGMQLDYALKEIAENRDVITALPTSRESLADLSKQSKSFLHEVKVKATDIYAASYEVGGMMGAYAVDLGMRAATGDFNPGTAGEVEKHAMNLARMYLEWSTGTTQNLSSGIAAELPPAAMALAPGAQEGSAAAAQLVLEAMVGSSSEQIELLREIADNTGRNEGGL